jgi:hypothetical protein
MIAWRVGFHNVHSTDGIPGQLLYKTDGMFALFSFYRDVANAPKLTDEEIKDFFSAVS